MSPGDITHDSRRAATNIDLVTGISSDVSFLLSPDAGAPRPPMSQAQMQAGCDCELYSSAQMPEQMPSVDVGTPKDEAVASPDHPTRPGPTVIRREEAKVNSTTEGFKAATALNIGSGPEVFHHSKDQRVQEASIESCNPVDPIEQASVLNHQLLHLRQLLNKLFTHEMSGLYDEQSSVQYQAVRKSLDNAIAELDRGLHVVLLADSIAEQAHATGVESLPARSLSYGTGMRLTYAPHEPSMGRGQQLSALRQPRQAANRGGSSFRGLPSDIGSYFYRQPSLVGGGRAPTYSPVPDARFSDCGGEAVYHSSGTPSYNVNMPDYNSRMSSFRTRAFSYGRHPSFRGRVPSSRGRDITPEILLSGRGPSSLRHFDYAYPPERSESDDPEAFCVMNKTAYGVALPLAGSLSDGENEVPQIGPKRGYLHVPGIDRALSGISQSPKNIENEVNQLGSGAVFTEWLLPVPGFKIRIIHPVTTADGPGDLSESVLTGIHAQLTSHNARIEQRDLHNVNIAKQYHARNQTIQTIRIWSEDKVAAKVQLAVAIMSGHVNPEKRDVAPARSESETSVAEPEAKSQVSALAPPNIANKCRGGKASFQEHQNPEPDTHRLRSGMGVPDCQSRPGPLHPVVNPQSDLEFTRVPARLKVGRVNALEAQQQALRDQIKAALSDVLPPTILAAHDPTQSTEATTTAPGRTAAEPVRAPEHAELSTDSLSSDRAEAASDVGDLNGFYGDG
ncbi:hypothetical protein LTR62_005156 [Meristemomyces frigidus]|uniref:Uncharacterized protein n=1 Tax=Meristemomyces frigidus TaxID=1508187 RepID=A0AAN7TEX6_9PEZI|nr:hypothetical protein LTR62_005156 [Meristemomyces frigidus]